jgi:Tfp pilus assembly protein FimT
MELLIVMAIIVVVFAIAVPLIQKPIDRNQILDVANKVRGKLYKARLGAMASNHAYAFQYSSGNGQYRLAPADDASASPGETASQSGDQGKTAEVSDAPRPESGSLPDGIRFQPDNTPDPDASDPAAQGAAQNSGDGWSDQIMFYPDGTTSDARFIVASNRGFAIHVTVRGVTGNVVLGGITKITE